MALNAISKQKKLSGVALELARRLTSYSATTPRRKRSSSWASARAAREVGMQDVAKEAEAREEKFEHQADGQYHQKAPPFTRSPYAGRKNKQADQVALMELFTASSVRPALRPTSPSTPF